MKSDLEIHHRRSIRLKGYDYSREGMYFITICTRERECFFGEITDGKMMMNDLGKIANEYLIEIPNHFPNVELGEYIVMPNHIHCVLMLGEPPLVVGTSHVMSLPGIPTNQNKFSKPVAGSVSVIIQQYKSSVKRWCNKNHHNDFQWQSRFYDHIIRDEKSYQAICNYIINNPKKWNDDNFYL